MLEAKPLTVALMVFPAFTASGCTGSPDGFFPSNGEPEALEITGIRVAQVQESGQPTYQGSIEFPYCTSNPNDFGFELYAGFEVFQRRGVPGSEYLHLVKKVEDTGWVYAGYDVGGGLGYVHHVLVNETTEGGFNYTVHLWHEILDPEPIHRWDYWYNATFVPYQQEVYYEEGEACWPGG